LNSLRWPGLEKNFQERAGENAGKIRFVFNKGTINEALKVFVIFEIKDVLRMEEMTRPWIQLMDIVPFQIPIQFKQN